MIHPKALERTEYMELVIVFTVIVCVITLLTIFRTISRNKNGGARLPPGPPPLPVIGNLLDLGDQPHKSLAKLAHVHGPIMRLKLGKVPTIVISSASLAKEVFQAHDLPLSDRLIIDAVRAEGHNEGSVIWRPSDAHWRNLRRICNNHIFSTQRLDANEHLRRNKVQELLSDVQESCRAGRAVNIGQVAFKTSLNAISSTMLSLNLSDSGSVVVNEFKEVVRRIMVEAGKPNLSDYFPALRKLDLQGIRRRMGAHFRVLHGIFGLVIEERSRSRKSEAYEPANDMLDTLLGISEANESEMDSRRMKNLFLDLFVAGTDTTSSTIEWAMAELLRNPSIMAKATTELEQVIGKSNHIDESDISRLPYLQAIIKETFRLHPPAPLLLPRKARSHVEVSGGFTITKDAQVFYNVWAIGRDPTIWKDHLSFVPERFLGSEVDIRGRHCELMPFGAGRRICPGLPLAMRMLPLTLGSLLLCFNWKLTDGVTPETLDMEEKFGIALQKAKPLLAVPLPKT